MTLDEISAMPKPNYFPWKHSEENDQSDGCNYFCPRRWSPSSCATANDPPRCKTGCLEGQKLEHCVFISVSEGCAQILWAIFRSVGLSERRLIGYGWNATRFPGGTISLRHSGMILCADRSIGTIAEPEPTAPGPLQKSVAKMVIASNNEEWGASQYSQNIIGMIRKLTPYAVDLLF
jgi:hypothetical protein